MNALRNKNVFKKILFIMSSILYALFFVAVMQYVVNDVICAYNYTLTLILYL